MTSRLLSILSVVILLLAATVIGASANQQTPTQAQAQIPGTDQDFADVPPSNPFFNFVRNIYRAGIVTGYQCGGPGEPCGPGNLPYYRPNASVTRAQMAKYADLSRKTPGIYIDTTTDSRPIFARTSVANGRAIEGDSANGNGLHGLSNSPTASGVYGENTSAGFGVAGRSNGAGKAVYGDNTNASGYAGYFNGNVRIVGSCCQAATGSFQIDDPLDPANKVLNQAAVQSSEMMSIYSGNATLDSKGEAWVQMPDWFQAVNQDFRYQLTAIGAPGPNLYIAQEIKDNRFQIAGGAPNSKVSWQVTGTRSDAYARQNPIQVEQPKPPSEQGKYLYPQLYGQPPDKGIGNQLP